MPILAAMAYLRLQDYLLFISQDQLDEVTDEKPFTRLQLEPIAEEEAASYLVQKYDVAREFKGISVYDPTNTYRALSAVYLDGDAWDATKAYVALKLVSLNSLVYQAVNPTTNVSPDANTGDWQLLGTQYQFYFGTLPQPEWDWTKSYKTGDIVWYLDNTYTATNPSKDIMPGSDCATGYWSFGTPYSIPANTITDGSKWSVGDLRCQRLVEAVVMLVLEKMYKHTAPRNVPQWIKDDYNKTISWLTNAAQGNTITIPVKELPNRVGHRVRITGNTKNINLY